MARLILNPGTPQGHPIPLKPGINSLGRRGGNDFTINDPSVSGSHCQVIVSETGVRLLDLGSTNGTFVNGARITEAELKPGEQILLGGVKLVFEGDTGTVRPLPILPEITPAPAAPAAAVTAAPPSITRMRIAHAKPKDSPTVAAVAVADPESVETEHVTSSEPANAMCKYHPKTPAHWMCTKCHKTYCDLCVTVRQTPSGSQKYCRSCGGVTSELEVMTPTYEERSFFKELPRAIIYPFRGTGILILIAATILFAALEFLSVGIIGWLMKAAALGYLFAYVQNIIHATAAGDNTLPELPGMDDLFTNFFRLLGTILMSFGPAILFAFLAISQAQTWAGIALIPAIIFGCLYLPMAFLAVAMKDDVMAANPLIVVPSILRVPLEYLVTAFLLAGVFGVRWLGDVVSEAMGGRAFSTTSVSEMLILFGLKALWAFLSVYLLTVTMRILGLLYLTKQDRLGW